MYKQDLADIVQAWADGATIEVKNKSTQCWLKVHAPLFGAHSIYRVAPTKPSINWDHVAARYKHLAVDKDGRAFLFEQRPEVHHGSFWMAKHGSVVSVSYFASFRLGTVDFRESLVTRP